MKNKAYFTLGFGLGIFLTSLFCIVYYNLSLSAPYGFNDTLTSKEFVFNIIK